MEGQTLSSASEAENDSSEDLERRVEQLERANAELRRANAALARERIGKRDAAAASAMVRVRKAEARAAKVETSISYRITWPLRLLKPVYKPVVSWLRSVRERIRLRLRRS